MWNYVGWKGREKIAQLPNVDGVEERVKNDEEEIRFRKTGCTRSQSHSDLSVLIGYSLKYVGIPLRIVNHSQRSPTP